MSGHKKEKAFLNSLMFMNQLTLIRTPQSSQGLPLNLSSSTRIQGASPWKIKQLWVWFLVLYFFLKMIPGFSTCQGASHSPDGGEVRVL